MQETGVMKTCPCCGKQVRAERTVCGCGELLTAEVTHVQPWETETVLGSRPTSMRKQNIVGAVAFLTGLAILGFAWIGVRQNLTSAYSQKQDAPVTSQAQNATTLDEPDELTPASSSQEGVFVFSPRNSAASRPTATHFRSERVDTVASTSDLPSAELPGANLPPPTTSATAARRQA